MVVDAFFAIDIGGECHNAGSVANVISCSCWHVGRFEYVVAIQPEFACAVASFANGEGRHLRCGGCCGGHGVTLVNKCSYCYVTMIDYCEQVVKYNRGGLYSDVCTLHLWGVYLLRPEWQTLPQTDNMTCASVVKVTHPYHWGGSFPLDWGGAEPLDIWTGPNLLFGR